MKKFLVLISAALICLSGITRDRPASWLMTVDNKLDCKRIHLGYNNARVVLTNGEEKIVPISSISSYSLKGKVFTRLPVYKDGKPTGEMQFMELIKTLGELSFYKLEEPDFGSTLLNAKIYSYFLYDGDKMHLALDEKSLPNICSIFGIIYHYK